MAHLCICTWEAAAISLCLVISSSKPDGISNFQFASDRNEEFDRPKFFTLNSNPIWHKLNQNYRCTRVFCNMSRMSYARTCDLRRISIRCGVETCNVTGIAGATQTESRCFDQMMAMGAQPARLFTQQIADRVARILPDGVRVTVTL